MAQRASVLLALRPNWNELVPLIEILANLRLECTQDLLRECLARVALAQRRAIIGEFREHSNGIAIAPAHNGHADQRTAGGPR